MPRQTAAKLLSFDPTTDTDPQTAKRWKRFQASSEARLRREAKQLKVTPAALRRNENLYLLAPDIIRIERAYRRSTAAGRSAMIAEMNSTFDRGYETGLDDATIPRQTGTR